MSLSLHELRLIEEGGLSSHLAPKHAVHPDGMNILDDGVSSRLDGTSHLENLISFEDHFGATEIDCSDHLEDSFSVSKAPAVNRLENLVWINGTGCPNSTDTTKDLDDLISLEDGFGAGRMSCAALVDDLVALEDGLGEASTPHDAVFSGHSCFIDLLSSSQMYAELGVTGMEQRVGQLEEVEQNLQASAELSSKHDQHQLAEIREAQREILLQIASLRQELTALRAALDPALQLERRFGEETGDRLSDWQAEHLAVRNDMVQLWEEIEGMRAELRKQRAGAADQSGCMFESGGVTSVQEAQAFDPAASPTSSEPGSSRDWQTVHESLHHAGAGDCVADACRSLAGKGESVEDFSDSQSDWSWVQENELSDSMTSHSNSNV
eukprot:TRINITY_DN22604_c0_g2_i1.p1 TRINITY_DN22604_c0_g2~~TRINITY_DN22604_c0_g2_i1.p1  ORF type:complete len:381 (-),score=76.30 TRINITY_DN22604_c0_g2_i1:109-1251(-)